MQDIDVQWLDCWVPGYIMHCCPPGRFHVPTPSQLLPWTPHLLATPAFSSAGNAFYVCGVYTSQKEGTKAPHLPEVEQ